MDDQPLLEKTSLTPDDLLLSGMPCYFGQRDFMTNPGISLPGWCSLCWDTLDAATASYRRLPCGHVLHLPCIDCWLCCEDASCPLCRTKFYNPRRSSVCTPDYQRGQRRSWFRRLLA
ncbi:hypothetical protein BDV59DRAFT_197568 [Aspergillus ambiguus]|uniref:uncharacterized protein n=1 Tax=Aspergillus ambiguus TaxID=176160 RepID=UPI003CCD003F